MALPDILVTGATGKTGSAVVTQLLDTGRPVRAVVHARDARSERLERLGATIVVADMFDPGQLLAAMRGTTSAYYCPPWHPLMLQSAVAFALAAREAKLEAIVGLTQWLASPSHPSQLTRQHWLADSVFAMLPDIAHVVVQPGYFADNYLFGNVIELAAQFGVFPWPYGESRNAPPSNEDIARVAAHALLDPQRHAGRAYRPTGPELLSGPEMAAILSHVLGRRVRAVPMPLWMFLKAARVAGVATADMLDLRTYVREHRAGTFAFNAPTSDVLDVTGHAPESFETIARRYAMLPQAQRSLSNFARALVEFMKIGLTPGYDLDGYARRFGVTAPAPQLALEDAAWRASHEAKRVGPVKVERLVVAGEAA